MSRVGKYPVKLPEKFNIKLNGHTLSVEHNGQSITKQLTLLSFVDVNITKESITVVPKNLNKKASRQAWGTTRALINNIILGLIKPFEKRLVLKGVGYRASVTNDMLKLQLGYSHDIDYKIPDGITIRVEDGVIIIKGILKEQVGQVASEIRFFRPPEPYKGKGVRYENEIIFLKDGKKK